METPTIILVNGFHIGDLFSLPQIVRAFCNSNQSVRVEMAIYNSFYLYRALESDTPNFHVVDINTHPLHKDIVEAIPGTVLCRNPCENTYILNFAGLQSMDVVQGRYLECHYMNLYTTMQLAVEHGNALWDTSFAMRPCVDPCALIPRIPDSDCTLFDTWRDANPEKLCILYYNFTPRSFQSIGISPRAHERIVYALCSHFPEAAILVPMFSDRMFGKPANLISCQDSFGCDVNPDCENLCKLAHMERRCTFSVHFDIGACFYYAGSLLYKESHCTVLHASRDHFYYYRLKENFGDSITEEEYTKKVRPLLATSNTSAFLQRLVHEIERRHI